MKSRASAGKRLLASLAAFVRSRRFLSATRLQIRCGKAATAAAGAMLARPFCYDYVLTLELTDTCDLPTTRRSHDSHPPPCHASNRGESGPFAGRYLHSARRF